MVKQFQNVKAQNTKGVLISQLVLSLSCSLLNTVIIQIDSQSENLCLILKVDFFFQSNNNLPMELSNRLQRNRRLLLLLVLQRVSSKLGMMENQLKQLPAAYSSTNKIYRNNLNPIKQIILKI